MVRSTGCLALQKTAVNIGLIEYARRYYFLWFKLGYTVRVEGCLNCRPLGNLQYLKIWHDNSGKGSSASWYLTYIQVKDLQTKVISTFIADSWMAVEKGDGSVSSPHILHYYTVWHKPPRK